MRILREIRSAFENYQVKSGIYHFYRGEFREAILFLERALSAGERLSDADAAIAREFLTQSHLSSADEAQSAGDLDRAVVALESAAEVNPQFPDIQFRLARALEGA